MIRKLALALVLLLMSVFLMVPSLSAADEEIRGFVKGSGWQYLQMGEYPYEEDGTPAPVLWRILAVDENRILVLTEYVLDTKQVIFETDQRIIEKHAFRRISTWSESDLAPWLNSEGMDLLFGQDPIRAAIIDIPERGYLHPLTLEELLNEDYGFSKTRWGEALNAHPSRQTVATPYAKSRGLYVNSDNHKSPYWCDEIKNPKDYRCGLVGYNGHISYGAYTNIKVGGLRLSVTLDRSRIRIAGGTGTEADPFIPEYTGSVPEPETAEEPEPVETSAPKPVEESASEPTEEPAPEPVEESIPEPVEEPAPGAEPESGETASSEPSEESAVLPGTEPAEAASHPDGTDFRITLVQTENAEGTALISLIGDCSIGDGYRSIGLASSYHSVVAREGYAWPFSRVVQYLAEDDLTVANLEVVLTTRSAHKDIMYPLRALPEHVNILTEGSIEVVNTVNNHCYDYYRDGYVDSLATLDAAGISRFGSIDYKKTDGFDDLLVRDVNGIRFGFVGITYPNNYDIQPIIDRVTKLKEEEGCDVVIVSLHWGRETHMTPQSGAIPYAKKLIDGGADVIYGHHPHVLQPIVFYKGKPILFSTGNFTFGSMSDVDPHTGIFRLAYRKAGDRALLSQLQVIPCRTSGSNDYRPYELTDEAERRKTFRILSPGRNYAGCENPPASFLDTGIIMLDEEGNIIDTEEDT